MNEWTKNTVFDGVNTQRTLLSDCFEDLLFVCLQELGDCERGSDDKWLTWSFRARASCVSSCQTPGSLQWMAFIQTFDHFRPFTTQIATLLHAQFTTIVFDSMAAARSSSHPSTVQWLLEITILITSYCWLPHYN